MKRYFVFLIIASALFSMGATSWTPPVPMPALLQGLRADSGPCPNDGCPGTVFFEPGVFSNAGGSTVYSSLSNILIDTTRAVGPNSRDRVDPCGLGTNNWCDGQGMFFYLLDCGSLAGLASPAFDYADVIVPTGCILLRKHPFMTNYHASYAGGIPSFHFAGTQNPTILWSQGPIPIGLSQPAGGVATVINLSHGVPAAGGARVVGLYFSIAPTTREGTVYIGEDCNHLVEVGVGNPAVGGSTDVFVTTRIQSDGTMCILRNTDGVQINNFSVQFYEITEVTN